MTIFQLSEFYELCTAFFIKNHHHCVRFWNGDIVVVATRPMYEIYAKSNKNNIVCGVKWGRKISFFAQNYTLNMFTTVFLVLLWPIDEKTTKYGMPNNVSSSSIQWMFASKCPTESNLECEKRKKNKITLKWSVSGRTDLIYLT